MRHGPRKLFLTAQTSASGVLFAQTKSRKLRIDGLWQHAMETEDHAERPESVLVCIGRRCGERRSRDISRANTGTRGILRGRRCG